TTPPAGKTAPPSRRWSGRWPGEANARYFQLNSYTDHRTPNVQRRSEGVAFVLVASRHNRRRVRQPLGVPAGRVEPAGVQDPEQDRTDDHPAKVGEDDLADKRRHRALPRPVAREIG